MKKKLKILIPILIGILFIYLTLKITSAQERELILNYIKSAKIQYLLLAMLIGATSDLIRGIRWQLLSKHLGYKSKTITSIGSVFMCYTSNMAIARSGEFIRASVLSNYNKIPVSKVLGTIAAERIVDVLISILILFSVWILQYDLIIESFLEDQFLFFNSDNLKFTILIGLIVLLFLFIIIAKIKSVRKFLRNVKEGLFSITKLKWKMPFFILYSVLIWGCYILAFFVIKFSVDEFNLINYNLIFPAFVVGVYSISLSNHGLGVYPLAISLFLSNFGISTELGLTYGWLAWSCQAIITLFFGGLSFFILPLINRPK